MKESYVIYDGRARFNIDEASVLDAADTVEEALSVAALQGPDSVIVEYDEKRVKGTPVLSNPRIVSTSHRRVS